MDFKILEEVLLVMLQQLIVVLNRLNSKSGIITIILLLKETFLSSKSIQLNTLELLGKFMEMTHMDIKMTVIRVVIIIQHLQ